MIKITHSSDSAATELPPPQATVSVMYITHYCYYFAEYVVILILILF